MKASMTRVLLTFAAWSVGAATVAGAQDAQRKRIAVLDFEYQTVRQYVHQIFGSDVDIGKGITTMLVTDLVRNGTYSVIERQALDQVLREQNFQASGRADASTAAELGKILGVDAVIIGSITQFGRDDQSVGAAGRVGVGPVRIGGFGRKKSKAVVGIDARIIDVQTAEILAVATGKGESAAAVQSCSARGSVASAPLGRSTCRARISGAPLSVRLRARRRRGCWKKSSLPMLGSSRR